MPVLKASQKQLTDAFVEQLEWRSYRSGSIGTRTVSIAEVAIRDADLIGRWVAESSVLSREGMHSFHQKLKDENCQSESIVLLGSIKLSVRSALQLRRGIFGLADAASEHFRRNGIDHLE